MFLTSFNHFRALAIVLIVASHCFALSNWNIDTIYEQYIACLITGGTVYFVFISGFLFHHVFYTRYNYFNFVKKKTARILIPYLVLSLLTLFVYFVLKEPPPKASDFFVGDGIFDTRIKPVLLYLMSGATWVPYWFIPCIMLIFALSPLFIAFIRAKFTTQLTLIILLFIVSIVMHRPIGNIGPIQSTLYFIPVYMIGIFCSVHKQRIYALLKGRDVWLLGVALFIAALQLTIYGGGAWGSFHKEMFELSRIDLLLPQKIVLCLFFMALLERYKDVDSQALNLLATSSFAVFFLHPFVILFFDKTQLFSYFPIQGGFLYPMVVITVTFISIILALLIKKTCGKFSRNITGW